MAEDTTYVNLDFETKIPPESFSSAKENNFPNRSGHSLIFLPHLNLHLLFGGMEMKDKQEVFYNDLWIKDGNTWKEVKPMKWELGNSNINNNNKEWVVSKSFFDSKPLPRAFCTFTVVNEFIFLFGGKTRYNKILNDPFILALNENEKKFQWHKVNFGKSILPSIYGHSCVCEGGLLFIFGGVSTISGPTKSTTYSPDIFQIIITNYFNFLGSLSFGGQLNKREMINSIRPKGCAFHGHLVLTNHQQGQTFHLMVGGENDSKADACEIWWFQSQNLNFRKIASFTPKKLIENQKFLKKCKIHEIGSPQGDTHSFVLMGENGLIKFTIYTPVGSALPKLKLASSFQIDLPQNGIMKFEDFESHLSGQNLYIYAGKNGTKDHQGVSRISLIGLQASETENKPRIAFPPKISNENIAFVCTRILEDPRESIDAIDLEMFQCFIEILATNKHLEKQATKVIDLLFSKSYGKYVHQLANIIKSEQQDNPQVPTISPFLEKFASPQIWIELICVGKDIQAPADLLNNSDIKFWSNACSTYNDPTKIQIAELTLIWNFLRQEQLGENNLSKVDILLTLLNAYYTQNPTVKFSYQQYGILSSIMHSNKTMASNRTKVSEIIVRIRNYDDKGTFTTEAFSYIVELLEKLLHNSVPEYEKSVLWKSDYEKKRNLILSTAIKMRTTFAANPFQKNLDQVRKLISEVVELFTFELTLLEKFELNLSKTIDTIDIEFGNTESCLQASRTKIKQEFEEIVTLFKTKVGPVLIGKKKTSFFKFQSLHKDVENFIKGDFANNIQESIKRTAESLQNDFKMQKQNWQTVVEVSYFNDPKFSNRFNFQSLNSGFAGDMTQIIGTSIYKVTSEADSGDLLNFISDPQKNYQPVINFFLKTAETIWKEGNAEREFDGNEFTNKRGELLMHNLESSLKWNETVTNAWIRSCKTVILPAFTSILGSESTTTSTFPHLQKIQQLRAILNNAISVCEACKNGLNDAKHIPKVKLARLTMLVNMELMLPGFRNKANPELLPFHFPLPNGQQDMGQNDDISKNTSELKKLDQVLNSIQGNWNIGDSIDVFESENNIQGFQTWLVDSLLCGFIHNAIKSEKSEELEEVIKNKIFQNNKIQSFIMGKSTNTNGKITFTKDSIKAIATDKQIYLVPDLILLLARRENIAFFDEYLRNWKQARFICDILVLWYLVHRDQEHFILLFDVPSQSFSYLKWPGRNMDDISPLYACLLSGFQAKWIVRSVDKVEIMAKKITEFWFPYISLSAEFDPKNSSPSSHIIHPLTSKALNTIQSINTGCDKWSNFGKGLQFHTSKSTWEPFLNFAFQNWSSFDTQSKIAKGQLGVPISKELLSLAKSTITAIESLSEEKQGNLSNGCKWSLSNYQENSTGTPILYFSLSSGKRNIEATLLPLLWKKPKELNQANVMLNESFLDSITSAHELHKEIKELVKNGKKNLIISGFDVGGCLAITFWIYAQFHLKDIVDGGFKVDVLCFATPLCVAPTSQNPSFNSLNFQNVTFFVNDNEISARLVGTHVTFGQLIELFTGNLSPHLKELTENISSYIPVGTFAWLLPNEKRCQVVTDKEYQKAILFPKIGANSTTDLNEVIPKFYEKIQSSKDSSSLKSYKSTLDILLQNKN